MVTYFCCVCDRTGTDLVLNWWLVGSAVIVDVLCGKHRRSREVSKFPERFLVDVYLPLWQPQNVTNEQLMALELWALELARWR
jgi:hypothetical protein